MEALLVVAATSLVIAGCDDDTSATSESQTGNVAIPRPSRAVITVDPQAIDEPQDHAVAPVNAQLLCPRFSDQAIQAGIQFRYDNGASGEALMVESTGGGAGWLDYDNDGRPDLYLVQGGNPAPRPGESLPSNRFFRNLPNVGFVDATAGACLTETGYGQGVTVGDFDNDGFDDVYVTNIGVNRLFHNLGDGTFEDVTALAGVDSRLWSSSAAWADLDHDGDLDLFVCNYLDYDPFDPLACPQDDGSPGVCAPNELDAVANACFENLGDGSFESVAKRWGLVAEGSKSLGVAIADFDDDGLVDVFVANDTEANFLFINCGKQRFEESGVASGCAMDRSGQYQASMGVGVGDYNRDGLIDLYLTHFTDDSNTLYTNLGSAGFEDVTQRVALRQPTWKYLGFGTVMADFNLDGREELFVTNGHIDDRRDDGEIFKMPPQLFTYADNRWYDCSQQSGPFFESAFVGRAVATADYDNDGDLDLAVVHQNDPAAILRNETTGKHYLKVQLTGIHSNRRGLGAKLTLVQGETRLVQQLVGGSSYCASHQPMSHFGLGDSDAGCSLIIRWPSGRTQRLDMVHPDQTLDVQEPIEEQLVTRR